MCATQLHKLAEIRADRQLTGVRWSPAGDRWASGAFDATVRWWRPVGEGWEEQPPLAGHRGWVDALAFSPDGQRLYTADSWGELRGWNCAPDQPPALDWSVPAAHDGWIRQLAVSPDGQRLATCGRDRCVRLWNAADGAATRSAPPGSDDIFSVAFHPDGGALVSGDLRGRVTHWSLPDLTVVRTLDAAALFSEDRLQEVGGARRLAFDPSGQRLAVAGTKPKNGGNVQGIPTVLLFDWGSGELRHTHQLGDVGDVYVCDVAFHPPTGQIVAVTSGNPGTGQILAFEPGGADVLLRDKQLANCHAASLAPDGEQLVVTSTNKGSNGNGRKLEADGGYKGNHSPVTLFRLETSQSG